MSFEMLFFLVFTGQAISEIGDSVFMSDSKGSCEAGQTPTTKAVDGSGTLQLTPKGLSKHTVLKVCPNWYFLNCLTFNVIKFKYTS